MLRRLVLRRLMSAVLPLLVAAATLPGARAQTAAPVEVSGAWARAAVAGQQGTGAVMTLKARRPARLVGAASAVAGVVEIHRMSMEGNVMRMRAVPVLDLPADQAVELKPGGYHVMLLDLQQPLQAGQRIVVELQIETADGRRLRQPVDIEVRAHAPGASR